MEDLAGLTLKDLLAMSPNTMLVVGLMWFLNKHVAPWFQSQIEFNASVRNFMDVQAPEISASWKTMHDSGVTRIVSEIGSAKTDVKEHVTREVRDKRADQIDAKIDRIAGRSNPDLSESVPKKRGG